ncbi:Uncharacterised protein [Bordetella pertussis]|nr:Uncharacterised protein [Bordetella pertussis]
MVLLAMPMTSSSLSNLNSGATGPKVSSTAKRIDCVTSRTTVGWKKLPPSACGSPPAMTLAPCAVASAMCSCTLATAAVSISGPWVTPCSKPSPTFMALTFSTRRLATSS